MIPAQIRQEITSGPYYQQNFANDGQRFVAWYLRRVLLRDPEAAQQPGDVLPLAATCLENAMHAALNNAQVSGRVFSPQNWLKSPANVQGEQLVSGTIAGMRPSFPNGKALEELLRVPANALTARWTAD